MLELSLQVEKQKRKALLSSISKNDPINTKIRLVMVVCILLGCVYLGFMCYFLSYFKRSDYDKGALIENKMRKKYGWMTGACFLIDSVGLLLSTCKLIKTIKRDFGNMMVQETKVLKFLFIIFTIAYLLRTVMLFT